MSGSRTERLLNLVIALRATRRGMRRDDLRRAVPQYAASPNDTAFERMFERDKEDLRQIGVPIVTVPSDVLVDAEDAYRIDAGAYELPEVTFTPAEVAVLGLQRTSGSRPHWRSPRRARSPSSRPSGPPTTRSWPRTSAGTWPGWSTRWCGRWRGPSRPCTTP